MGKRSYIFLDRDGTINIDTGYISDHRGLELISGAAKALGDLKRAGFGLVVVSNQSGIGRGLITEEQLSAVNNRLRELLISEDSDAVLDAILYCPHAPDQGCACRKPLAGMLEGFILQHQPRLENCWMVGDKISDLDLGKTLKIPESKRCLVLTGNGSSEQARLSSLDYSPTVVDALPSLTALAIGSAGQV